MAWKPKTELVNITDLGFKNLYEYIEDVFFNTVYDKKNQTIVIDSPYVIRCKIGYDKDDLETIDCVLFYDDYLGFDWDIDEGQKWIKIIELVSVEKLMDFFIDESW